MFQTGLLAVLKLKHFARCQEITYRPAFSWTHSNCTLLRLFYKFIQVELPVWEGYLIISDLHVQKKTHMNKLYIVVSLHKFYYIKRIPYFYPLTS